MTQEIHIFVDLDGVLADFDSHANAHQIMDGAGKMQWDLMDYAWWSTIPPFQGARDFYDDLSKRAKDNKGELLILSAPTMSADCFGGKAKWVQDFLPDKGKFVLTKLIIATKKHHLAGPHSILIDDRMKNVKAWRDAGGIAILHEGDFNQTLSALDQALQKLKSRPAPNKKPQCRL